MPKLQYDYEACRSGGHPINLDHLGFFSMPLNKNTLVFFAFCPIEVRPPWPGIEPVLSSSAVKSNMMSRYKDRLRRSES